MSTRKQRDDKLLGLMRQAARGHVDKTPERIPNTFDARLAYEQEALSMQVVAEVNRSMRRKGMSQQELANRLGVSEGRVSQILSGEQNLTIKTLASLASALKGHFKVVLEDADGYPWTDEPHGGDTGAGAAAETPTDRSPVKNGHNRAVVSSF